MRLLLGCLDPFHRCDASHRRLLTLAPQRCSQCTEGSQLLEDASGCSKQPFTPILIRLHILLQQFASQGSTLCFLTLSSSRGSTAVSHVWLVSAVKAIHTPILAEPVDVPGCKLMGSRDLP